MTESDSFNLRWRLNSMLFRKSTSVWVSVCVVLVRMKRIISQMQRFSWRTLLSDTQWETSIKSIPKRGWEQWCNVRSKWKTYRWKDSVECTIRIRPVVKNTHLCISSISKLIFLVIVLARQEGSKSVYRCFAFDNILSKSTTAYIHIRCVQRVGWMVMEKKDTRDEQSKQQTNDQYICWSSFLSVFLFSPYSFHFIESYVWNQYSGLV